MMLYLQIYFLGEQRIKDLQTYFFSDSLGIFSQLTHKVLLKQRSSKHTCIKDKPERSFAKAANCSLTKVFDDMFLSLPTVAAESGASQNKDTKKIKDSIIIFCNTAHNYSVL